MACKINFIEQSSLSEEDKARFESEYEQQEFNSIREQDEFESSMKSKFFTNGYFKDINNIEKEGDVLHTFSYNGVSYLYDTIGGVIKSSAPKDIDEYIQKNAPTINKPISELFSYNRLEQVEEESTLFNQELFEKIQQKLQQLYPEIKLTITNNPIWEHSDNVLNQEDFNNKVQYRFKSVNVILNSLDKIKSWENNKSISEDTLWDKIQQLGIPKEQISLLKKSEGKTVEDKLVSFATNYSYAIEISTSMYDADNTVDYIDDRGNYQFLSGYLPTQHYSNLTVPGGTNYTENKIETPQIIPSIQGHAKWVKSDGTDKGIGWFRSDDKIRLTPVKMGTITEAKSTYDEGDIEQMMEGGFSREEAIEHLEELFKTGVKTVFSNVGELDGKTRRILEVQSDWGQKQRKSSEPDINVKYDIQQIINDLQKSGDLKIDCN